MERQKQGKYRWLEILLSKMIVTDGRKGFTTNFECFLLLASGCNVGIDWNSGIFNFLHRQEERGRRGASASKCTQKWGWGEGGG